MTSRLPALALTLLFLACGPSNRLADRDGDVRAERGGTVVSGTALLGHGGSVLDAVASRVAGMQVDFTGLERCPAITLRSAKDLRGRKFPDVYVDGTRAGNTCILESLRAADVERVEVYPMGFTTRPGYGHSTHGLILVFMRQG